MYHPSITIIIDDPNYLKQLNAIFGSETYLRNCFSKYKTPIIYLFISQPKDKLSYYPCQPVKFQKESSVSHGFVPGFHIVFHVI